MAAPYPTYFPYAPEDPRPRPNIVYVDPYDDYGYDYESPSERLNTAMERTAEYVSGLNPNSPDVPHGLPPLAIRRHVPGSTDPSLQRIPANFQPASQNTRPYSKLNVTIKRNSVSSHSSAVRPVARPVAQPVVQPVVQPLLYPVNVFVNSPASQYPAHQPMELMPPVRPAIKPKSLVKLSPTPPVAPTRYETESFYPPNSRGRHANISPRRPIHLDSITPSPPTLKPRKVRSSQLVTEEFDDYDEEYRVPTVYAVPKKVTAYLPAPGMTTRELENDQMDRAGKPAYVESPQVQTITYRA